MTEIKNTMLIVDDEAGNLASFKYAVADYASDIIDILGTATLVIKAEEMLLEIPKDKRPNIIVLDGQMPWKDPIEFIQFLIDNQYTWELFLCSTSEETGKKMMKFLNENNGNITFKYADTELYKDKDNKTKWEWAVKYIQESKQESSDK